MKNSRTRAELSRENAELERKLHEWMEFLPDAVLQGPLPLSRVHYINRMGLVVFGYSAEDVARGIAAEALFAEGEFERMQEIVARYVGHSIATRTPYARSGIQDLHEFRLRRKDGSTFEAEGQTSFILDADGIPVGLRSIVRDITSRKQMERRLEELSYRDPLTGCYNRHYLEQQREALECEGAQWGCLVFDLDGFKVVNDSFGHDEGDRVLSGFAHFVARQHRPGDSLVRTGGDEFALIVHGDAAAEVDAVSHRLLAAAAVGSPAAFSMGHAVRRSGETLEATLARADRNMYAKRGRRLRPA